IVAGVVIVVLALCGLGYFMLSGDDEGKETTSSSSSESSDSSSSSSESSDDSSSSSSTSDDKKDKKKDQGKATFGKKYTGQGNDELPAPEVDGPALMKVHYEGDSNFVIWGTDANGKDSELI